MGQELVVPQAFQGRGMSQAFVQAGLSAQDDSLAEGIGQSYGVIRYKGKVWSMRHRGETKPVLRPDDGTPASYLDVIILGQAKSKSKSYYKAFDPNQSEGDRPICASIDGIVPDADVTQKQCDTCALCPRNAWKTQPNGKKGRECTDYKRLAVLVLPTQTKPTFGAPIMEPMFLRVPPDSLNSLAIMGETMGNQGHHYNSYITRITFDPQKAHPCMVFRPLQPLSDQEAPVILELARDPLVERITHGETSGLRAVGNALSPPQTNATGLVAGVPTPTTQPQPAPVTQQQSQPGATATPLNTHSSGGFVQQVPSQQMGHGTTPPIGVLSGAGAAPPATPSPNTSVGLTKPSVVSVSEASIGASSVSPARHPQTQQTDVSATVGAAASSVVDTGPAEASDDELDAQIAALITPK